MKTASESVFHLMQRDWSKEVQNKPKLRTYVLFKDKVAPEMYCSKIIDRQRRAIFAQFRCGILPIKIETGRFRKMKVEERLCEMCNLGKVEDEAHFLCECPRYKELRVPLIRTANDRLANFNVLSYNEQLSFLVKELWREVSFFLVDAWNLRKVEIYQ